MTWKSILGLLVALAIGGGVMFYGINDITSGTVSCGGQTMTRGDTCVATKNGSTTKRTYDEQKGQGRQGSYIGIGFGALIVLGAVFFTVAGARSRRAEKRAANPNPTPS
jgi:hypothetical protein